MFARRLVKPVLFTSGLLGFNYFCLPHLPDLKTDPKNVVLGIIGLNALGVLAWRTPGKPMRFMYKYGLLQSQFNEWQLLGSAFSHQSFRHFGINMFMLYQFGVPLAYYLGSTKFLGFYLNSCVVSSLGSLMLNSLRIPSLGASGAVFSCFGMFSYLMPHTKLALWFIPIPLDAWTVFLATLGLNAGSLVYKRFPNIDYAGHVSGSLYGILAAYFVNKKYRRRTRRPRFLFK